MNTNIGKWKHTALYIFRLILYVWIQTYSIGFVGTIFPYGVLLKYIVVISLLIILVFFS